MTASGPRTFIGSKTRKVDDKGRSPVPRKFRKVLDRLESADEVVLAILQDPSHKAVRVYTLQGWERLVDKLVAAELTILGERVARRFMASAEPCELDRSGRILIPAEHRQHLELDGEVIWSGQGPVIDLLNPKAYDKMRSMPLDQQAKGSEEIRKFVRGVV